MHDNFLYIILLLVSHSFLFVSSNKQSLVPCLCTNAESKIMNTAARHESGGQGFVTSTFNPEPSEHAASLTSSSHNMPDLSGSVNDRLHAKLQHSHAPGAECPTCNAFVLICFQSKDGREYAQKVPVARDLAVVSRTLDDPDGRLFSDAEAEIYLRVGNYWRCLSPEVVGWKRFLPIWGLIGVSEANVLRHRSPSK